MIHRQARLKIKAVHENLVLADGADCDVKHQQNSTIETYSSHIYYKEGMTIRQAIYLKDFWLLFACNYQIGRMVQFPKFLPVYYPA